MRCLTIIAFGICLPLLAAPKQTVEVTTTERVPFPAGTIRLNGGMGEINVEGWEQPEVEITLTRSVFRTDTPKNREQAKRDLDLIRIVTNKPEDRELAIATTLPPRKLLRPLRGQTDFTLVYSIKAPRNARLMIRHDVGGVQVYGMAGDIDVTARVGDVLLQLPQSGQYTIDAKSRFGDVYSDFAGIERSLYFVGQSFAQNQPSPSHRIHLRIGVGGIKIQKVQ